MIARRRPSFRQLKEKAGRREVTSAHEEKSSSHPRGDGAGFSLQRGEEDEEATEPGRPDLRKDHAAWGEIHRANGIRTERGKTRTTEVKNN